MTVACPLHAIIAGLDQTLVATERPPQDVLRRVYQRCTAICDHRRFDPTLLGLAEDSLSAARFPKEPSCAGLAGWVLVIKRPQPEPRIIMTSPVLAYSRDVAFVASGSNQQGVVARPGQRQLAWRRPRATNGPTACDRSGATPAQV